MVATEVGLAPFFLGFFSTCISSSQIVGIIWLMHLQFWSFSEVQDTFDHDKGQKSAISGRAPSRLDFFKFSPVDSPFSPDFLCNLVRKSPQNVKKISRSPGGEKSIESCDVFGCLGFFRSRELILQSLGVEGN